MLFREENQQWHIVVYTPPHTYLLRFLHCIWPPPAAWKNIMCAMRHTTKILKKETTFPKSRILHKLYRRITDPSTLVSLKETNPVDVEAQCLCHTRPIHGTDVTTRRLKLT